MIMANTIERSGTHYCGLTAENNKWLFREQPINDIGIDAHIEFIDSSNKPKQLIALQIKSGSSWFKEKNKGCVIFRDIDENHYLYWTMNSLPCIIVLYNPDDNTCIWQELSNKTIEKTKNGSGKGYFVKIPLNQIFLDSSSNEKLLSLTNLPEHIVNYNFLLSQKVFMEVINNGGVVKLHSYEWVNKSSGRGDTELIIDDGKEIKKYSYPYWFPYTPYIDVFPRLFPWAAFTTDNDFYEDNDETLWRDLNCWYDKEEDDWIVVGESFKEFRANLNPMRSIDHAGEVAEYMLILTLNDLGKAFLKIDEFVSNVQPYNSVRPKGGDEEV